MFVFPRGLLARYLISLFCLLPAMAQAGERLSLDDAQSIALARDLEIARLDARREAMGERAIAAAQLPDPGVKLGLMSVPVDSFALDQEPMTQMVVGAQQMFPAGETRSLRKEQILVQSQVQTAMADDRRRQVVAQLRRLWIELAYKETAARVQRSQLELYQGLSDTVETRYTAGRGGQQDIVRVELEQNMLQENLIALKRDSAALRSNLSEWIGEAAFGELDLDGLVLPELPAQDSLAPRIADNPMVLADRVQMEASQVGEQLASQRYKPDWGVEVSYGIRDGVDPMGVSRPDFFSAMVMFSVPMFTGDRQDRMVAAAEADTRAALSQVKNRQRTLLARVQAAYERYTAQQEMLALYREEVLPASRANVIATLNAYQGQRASFDEYIRAENMALEKTLRVARLTADSLAAQAEILYLAGDTQ
ncbi:MAG: TolC family protein [Chromatiales bacterium]|nr:TolC family protein [Chromatiales bacterium]